MTVYQCKRTEGLYSGPQEEQSRKRRVPTCRDLLGGLLVEEGMLVTKRSDDIGVVGR